MTDSIRIDPGVKRILVNNDPERVIEFNPTNPNFATRFYKLLSELEEKQKEYQRQAKKLETVEVDGFGLPVNLQASIDLLVEACAFLRERIDYLFGPGTSQAAFGDEISLDMFVQFFDGIAPFIEKARSDQMARYLTNKKAGRVMKAASREKHTD